MIFVKQLFKKSWLNSQMFSKEMSTTHFPQITKINNVPYTFTIVFIKNVNKSWQWFLTGFWTIRKHITVSAFSTRHSLIKKCGNTSKKLEKS